MQATTNLLAQALADKDEERSQTVVSQALAISLGAGVAVMAVIEAFGTQMLRRTIGADGPLLVPVSLKVRAFVRRSMDGCMYLNHHHHNLTDTTTNLTTTTALQYTTIRAIGAPAVLMSMVAQSALLGAKDSVTPLLVTLGAGFINFVLDIGLVSFGKMGISGAALATVTAEIVGACVRACVKGFIWTSGWDVID